MDESKVKQVVDAIRGGSDLLTACHFAGINYRTIYRVVERGQREAERLERGEPALEEEATCLALWQELRKARADAVVRNVALVQKAANQGDWKAAAWWLEHALPDVYGKNVKSAGELS